MSEIYKKIENLDSGIKIEIPVLLELVFNTLIEVEF